MCTISGISYKKLVALQLYLSRILIDTKLVIGCLHIFANVNNINIITICKKYGVKPYSIFN